MSILTYLHLFVVRSCCYAAAADNDNDDSVVVCVVAVGIILTEEKIIVWCRQFLTPYMYIHTLCTGVYTCTSYSKLENTYIHKL